MFRNWDRLPALWAFAGTVGLVFGAVTLASAAASITVGKLRLATLRSGYSLSIIATGDRDPIEPDERIRLEHGKSHRMLKGLTDLKGVVSINTAKDALDFVRLRTSRTTWYMWGGVPTVEVIEWHRGVQIESYGRYSYSQADKPVGFPWGVPAWRMKQAGFTPAKVETSGASYVLRDG